MEANPAPSDNENGLNTQQATNVENAQAADNTNGQSPMRKPVIAQTQANGQTRMQTDVAHPPFRIYVQTPPMYARATQTGTNGVLNYTTVGNGPSHDNQCKGTAPMRIPHFSGQGAYAPWQSTYQCTNKHTKCC